MCVMEWVYRVKNWPEYNAGLIERGNVSIWMDEQMFVPRSETSSRRGRPQAYCDGVIQILLTLKSVYRKRSANHALLLVS